MSSDERTEAEDTVDARPASEVSPGVPHSQTDGGCISRAVRCHGEVDDASFEEWRDPEEAYDMTHGSRGHALIISQEIFSTDLKLTEGLTRREGTRVDEDHLRTRLKSLGFSVMVYNNLQSGQMVRTCERMAKKDHSDCDCFVCVILSHGEEGIIFGYDKAVEIGELVKPFTSENCPSLSGKPKLFFLQACRGHDVDRGVKVSVHHGLDVTDSVPGPENIALPAYEPDFLFVHSTVPGFFSWRNSGKGSWFIQALTEALKLYGDQYEIQKLMTFVIRKVAIEFASVSEQNPGMKQTSCFRSMLTKDLFFKKKEKSS